MKTTSKNRNTAPRKRAAFPEQQVGFPERNDASIPVEDMERVHVDLETLNLSRKSGKEVTRDETKP